LAGRVSLAQAEAQELAVHIHFDAKYRIENITELFGDVDEDLSEEKANRKRGTYKRADLLKMPRLPRCNPAV